MIDILIADDHPIILNGIKNAFSNEDTFNIVACVNNGNEVLAILKKERIDVLLLDLEMPEMNGLMCLKTIKELEIDVKVIIFSMYQKPSILKRIIELGANGYLLKTLQNDELIYAIKKIYGGQDYFDSNLTKNLIESKELKVNKLVSLGEKSVIVDDLSKREKEVIILVSEGFTNKQIGEQLFLSHKTIDGYRTSAMKKIGVHNTAGIIRFAFKNGLLDQ
jgi:two-component system response regulator NreC